MLSAAAALRIQDLYKAVKAPEPPVPVAPAAPAPAVARAAPAGPPPFELEALLQGHSYSAFDREHRTSHLVAETVRDLVHRQKRVAPWIDWKAAVWQKWDWEPHASPLDEQLLAEVSVHVASLGASVDASS